MEKNKKTKRRKKKEKLEQCWTQHIGKKKKKERTDIFSKIDNTSLHRLKKKEEKKTEHFWVCLCLKATLEFFFFPVHIMKFDENH